MLKMNCPHCGEHLRIREKYARRAGRCARCGLKCKAPPLAQSRSAPTQTPAPTQTRRISGRSLLLAVGSAVVVLLAVGVTETQGREKASEASEHWSQTWREKAGTVSAEEAQRALAGLVRMYRAEDAGEASSLEVLDLVDGARPVAPPRDFPDSDVFTRFLPTGGEAVDVPAPGLRQDFRESSGEILRAHVQLTPNTEDPAASRHQYADWLTVARWSGSGSQRLAWVNPSPHALSLRIKTRYMPSDNYGAQYFEAALFPASGFSPVLLDRRNEAGTRLITLEPRSAFYLEVTSNSPWEISFEERHSWQTIAWMHYQQQVQLRQQMEAGMQMQMARAYQQQQLQRLQQQGL